VPEWVISCSRTRTPSFAELWDDLAARLVWARDQGHRTARVRQANGYADRPPLRSEQVRLVEEATRLATTEPGDLFR
jgi:hypothetical protein